MWEFVVTSISKSVAEKFNTVRIFFVLTIAFLTSFVSFAQIGDFDRGETWTKNPRNPSGFDKKQSTDVTGKPHRNKATGKNVPTPHTQGKDIPGGVRPATPDEIPKPKT